MSIFLGNAEKKEKSSLLTSDDKMSLIPNSMGWD